MKFPLLNIDGSKADSIEISDKLVKLKVNHKLIKFVIDWQFNHLKPRTAKTKQRNEIKGSTTEKATILSEQNKTVFKVHKTANKKTIKKNIEKLFKVNVVKVNIINRKKKLKMKQEKK